jgi:hypothetical protein
MTTINTGSFEVSTTAVEIVPANANRTELRLLSFGVNAPVYYGDSSAVTPATGYPANGLTSTTLAETTLDSMTGAVWAIAPGPMTVYFMEITGP